MMSLVRIFRQYKSRSLLISVALLLVFLNLGRFGVNYYNQLKQEVDNKAILLDQYDLSARKLQKFQYKVDILEQELATVKTSLFEGESPEKIASAMQIIVQDLVVRSGLKPESLRPILSKGQLKDKEKKLGEIIIKVRLSGELNQFLNFLSGLYQSENFFRLENCTIKPYKKTDLKIFLELKGFFSLA